jgi:hypothetical protein
MRGSSGDIRWVIVARSRCEPGPTYKNSLTHLGRAYYRKGGIKTLLVLQRAAVNKDDETA